MVGEPQLERGWHRRWQGRDEATDLDQDRAHGDGVGDRWPLAGLRPRLASENRNGSRLKLATVWQIANARRAASTISGYTGAVSWPLRLRRSAHHHAASPTRPLAATASQSSRYGLASLKIAWTSTTIGVVGNAARYASMIARYAVVSRAGGEHADRAQAHRRGREGIAAVPAAWVPLGKQGAPGRGRAYLTGPMAHGRDRRAPGGLNAWRGWSTRSEPEAQMSTRVRWRSRLAIRLILTTVALVAVVVVGSGVLATRQVSAIYADRSRAENARFREALAERGSATTAVFAEAILPLLVGNQEADIAALIASLVRQDPSLRVVYVLDRDQRVVAACEVTTRGTCGAAAPAPHQRLATAAWQALLDGWRAQGASSDAHLLATSETTVAGVATALFAKPVFAAGTGTAAAAVAVEAPDDRYGYVVVGYDLSPLTAFARATAAAQAVATSASVRRTFAVGAGALAVGVVLAILQALRLARPLRRLAAQADQIARGDLTGDVTTDRTDEVGQLATAFAAMVQGVRDRDRALRDHNDALERTVAARTRAIALLLDTTGDALIPVGLNGQLADGASAAARAWLGEPRVGALVLDYLCPEPGTLRGCFELGFAQLTDDVLPFEVAADQLPRQLTRGDRTIALTYRPVLEDGAVVQVLVIGRDITVEVAAARAGAAARELHAATVAISRDRRGFARFAGEVDGHLTVAATGVTMAERLRALHTIKGDAGSLGLARLAAIAHGAEERIAAEPSGLVAAVAEVAAAWRTLRDQLGDQIGLDADEVVLTAAQHADFLRRLDGAREPRALVAEVKSWRDEPVAPMLARVGAHAQALARRGGKELAIVVQGGTVAIGRESGWLYSSLVHLVRNVVDHGLEPADDRLAAGKPAAGTLTLAAVRRADTIVVTCADDGRGIDWGRVRAAAGPRADGAALSDLIFCDGVSTAEAVTETSGRGVGLSAVRAACRAAGGDIAVTSELGCGTTFAISLRRAAVCAA